MGMIKNEEERATGQVVATSLIVYIIFKIIESLSIT